jgi:hypothetical protein
LLSVLSSFSQTAPPPGAVQSNVIAVREARWLSPAAVSALGKSLARCHQGPMDSSAHRAPPRACGRSLNCILNSLHGSTVGLRKGAGCWPHSAHTSARHPWLWCGWAISAGVQSAARASQTHCRPIWSLHKAISAPGAARNGRTRALCAEMRPDWRSSTPQTHPTARRDTSEPIAHRSSMIWKRRPRCRSTGRAGQLPPLGFTPRRRTETCGGARLGTAAPCGGFQAA